ncbi:MAG TPA: DEAD/DEAH box helicase [Spirochaetia bacterium]|nr:DEAD/DEAH box helicase [Spirochaetia bacterium]
MTFNDFALKSELIQAVSEIGFEIATPIQERVIPYMLENDVDLTALAQTGTGKTAAFGLPILNSLTLADRFPQALVICPTRELCMQITGDLQSYGKYLHGLSVTAVYGGDSMDRQIRAMRAGTHVVVATPGRLLDLMNRKAVDAARVRYLVLDEADIMLNMGFKEEMDAILSAVPSERQTVLLSATMSHEVARIAAEYMKNPVEISAGARNAGASTVEHGYYMVHARDKYVALKRIVDFHPDMYAIVFCRTRASTQDVADRMIKDGYNAEALHGEMAQPQRDLVMRKFRQRNLQLLVATDIAARGLDVDDLTHVIHYDLPDEPEVYTHRSGRTGRAGKSGISLSIINLREKYKIRQAENAIRGKITEIRIPTGQEICERQLMHQIDRVKAVEVDTDRIARYMPIIEEKLVGLDREQILAHFVSLEFNRFLDYYKSAAELSPVSEFRSSEYGSDRGRSRVEGRGRIEDSVNLVLNIGKKDRVLPADVIGIINRATRGSNVNIGRIDIGEFDTRLQIEAGAAAIVIASVRGQSFRSRKLRVEEQKGSPYARPPGRPGGYKGKRSGR